MDNLKRNILGALCGAGTVVAAVFGASQIWRPLYREQAVIGEVYRRAEVMSREVVKEAESLADLVEVPYFKIIPALAFAGWLGWGAYKLSRNSS